MLQITLFQGKNTRIFTLFQGKIKHFLTLFQGKKGLFSTLFQDLTFPFPLPYLKKEGEKCTFSLKNLRILHIFCNFAHDFNGMGEN